MDKAFMRNFIANAEQIAGDSAGTGSVLRVSAGNKYVDGQRTDEIDHYKYTVVFPHNGYEKVIVKIKGNKPLITNEQIQEKGGEVKIALKNLTGRFYRTNSGEYALSASAEGMEVLQ